MRLGRQLCSSHFATDECTRKQPVGPVLRKNGTFRKNRKISTENSFKSQTLVMGSSRQLRVDFAIPFGCVFAQSPQCAALAARYLSRHKKCSKTSCEIESWLVGCELDEILRFHVWAFVKDLTPARGCTKRGRVHTVSFYFDLRDCDTKDVQSRVFKRVLCSREV
jgi:hypothetical protein